ncbi:acetate/propionate family kinase [bacterium]|nr:acetate/propionate family kinase [bacterium]
MKILIANPGSTSYKCRCYDMADETLLFQGGVERIGEAESDIFWQFQDQEKQTLRKSVQDYPGAIRELLQPLEIKIPLSEIGAVGFKTVHARDITGCVELTDEVLEAMKAYAPLVPVHNAAYLTAIRAFRSVMPRCPLIGLFETHFHRNMPPEAAMYGVPLAWVEKYGVRKYGFHGASHRYIAEHSAALFKANRIISCHLGGSSSVCAIRDGVSLDTSMGMSAQCGLFNAKRVGDLDPFALLYVMEEENLTIAETRDILMSRSGMLGLSGLSGDLRDIEQALDTDSNADLAFKAFAYGVKRYIGEYLAVLNGADLIVFTGGAGQHSPRLRETVLGNMDNLGIVLDAQKNRDNPAESLISADDSPVRVAVIPTQEEIIVAREVARKLNADESAP